MSHRRTTVVAALLAFVLVAAACGGDNKVGSDELLEGAGGEGNLSLGSTTTVTAQDPADPGPTDTTAPPTTAPPTTAPPTTAAPQDNAAIEIEIRGDDVSPQMNPPVARVFAGSTIRWRNVDSEPRSVKADDGSFFSGDIPPGGTWEYTFGAPGTVNYKDGTRPYVTAQVEVLAG